MEHEQRQAQYAELSSDMTKVVGVLFDGVTDENDGFQAPFAMLLSGMLEHPLNLCVSAKAANSSHFIHQGRC